MKTSRPLILLALLSLTAVAPLRAADRGITPPAGETPLSPGSLATRYTGPTPRYTAMVRELTWYDPVRKRPLPALIYFPTGGNRCPVVLFSTGLGRSREDCAYLGRFWASCGYVAVHLQHKGSDEEEA
jgi:predicted dienelactone hydrolase